MIKPPNTYSKEIKKTNSHQLIPSEEINPQINPQIKLQTQAFMKKPLQQYAMQLGLLNRAVHARIIAESEYNQMKIFLKKKYNIHVFVLFVKSVDI